MGPAMAALTLSLVHPGHLSRILGPVWPWAEPWGARHSVHCPASRPWDPGPLPLPVRHQPWPSSLLERPMVPWLCLLLPNSDYVSPYPSIPSPEGPATPSGVGPAAFSAWEIT